MEYGTFLASELFAMWEAYNLCACALKLGLATAAGRGRRVQEAFTGHRRASTFLSRNEG